MGAVGCGCPAYAEAHLHLPGFYGVGLLYGLPRVLRERAVWDWGATAVPLLGVIAPRVWETEIELGCASVSQHEAVALWGPSCYCGVRPGLGVS